MIFWVASRLPPGVLSSTRTAAAPSRSCWAVYISITRARAWAIWLLPSEMAAARTAAEVLVNCTPLGVESVPVSFAEIAPVSVLCEIVSMGNLIVPNVSLGTHFFNDLVEANMLYLAVFPKGKESPLNEGFFLRSKNRLAELLPDDSEWSGVVRVIDVPGRKGGRKLVLNANTLKQRAVC